MHPDSEKLTTFYIRYKLYKYKVLLFGLIKGNFKSNPQNAKSNLNYNPKSTLTTPRALTHNTCYAHTIKKESRVLDSVAGCQGDC